MAKDEQTLFIAERFQQVGGITCVRVHLVDPCRVRRLRSCGPSSGCAWHAVVLRLQWPHRKSILTNLAITNIVPATQGQ
jgi:hypothetical protein